MMRVGNGFRVVRIHLELGLLSFFSISSMLSNARLWLSETKTEKPRHDCSFESLTRGLFFKSGTSEASATVRPT